MHDNDWTEEAKNEKNGEKEDVTYDGIQTEMCGKKRRKDQMLIVPGDSEIVFL